MIKNYSKTNELFRVENTEQGLAELKLIKLLFKKTPFKLIIRGRNSNRKQAIEKAGLVYSGKHKRDMPIKLSTHLSVYVIHKQTSQHLTLINSNIKTKSDYDELTNLRYENHQLKTKLSTIRDIARNYQ